MALLEIFDPKAPPRPIGIDLGTTNSLVAYVRDDRPVAILDCDQQALTPSVVHYDRSGAAIVGRAAKSRAAEHPKETIASVKRFMGKGASDEETRRLSPYDFVPEIAGQPNVVRFRVGTQVLTPMEISAEILFALKELAVDELGSVGGVVITVPAYFDDAQRQATRDAGRLAGLDVLRLLNEPTAAALAYGLEKKKDGLFAVYDLGGGTFDITVLRLEDGVFQVRSTGGDSSLGGDDMDAVLAEHLFAQLGLDASRRSPSVVRVMLDAARELKHQLTTSETAAMVNPLGVGPSQLGVSISEFNALIAPILERTGVSCRRALRDAEIKPADLDGVILVGGSTRVRAVRAYVHKLFGHEPLGDIDPDQVVALGAAVQAHQLAGEGDKHDLLLLDVLPLSLGIEVGGGVVDKILPRNTTIPAGAKGTYTTQKDLQTGFEIHVLQGERELAQDCRSLAKFTLRGIPPLPAGMARLEVRFNVDENGILSVDAKETVTGITQHVEVKPAYGLDDETVERMLLEAIDHGEEDLAARKLQENRVEGERVLLATETSLLAAPELISEAERGAIASAMQALAQSVLGTDAARIQLRIEDLDHATKEFAERRMNLAISKAIEGKNLGEVEQSVSHAKGIEAAHDP